MLWRRRYSPMRSSYLVLCVVVWVGACAHQIEISSSTVKRWENRDVSELINTIGPYDKTLIQGDSRTYDWYRFSNCLVTARTSRDEKILKIEVQGTTQGCSVYLEKMGDGETPKAKP
jgi:hypothetical protein